MAAATCPLETRNDVPSPRVFITQCEKEHGVLKRIYFDLIVAQDRKFRAATIKKLLHILAMYVKFHFDHERDFMIAINYNNYEFHDEIHSNFINLLSEIDRDSNDGIDVLDRIRDMYYDLTKGHIPETDHALIDYARVMADSCQVVGCNRCPRLDRTKKSPAAAVPVEQPRRSSEPAKTPPQLDSTPPAPRRPIVPQPRAVAHRLRREHARRLWTDWIDAVLVRDDLFLLSMTRLPGALHIVDAGSWWFALAGALPEFTQSAQNAIAALIQHEQAEKVYASPAAHEWRERLRSQTLSFLEKVRTKPKGVSQLLAVANAHRERLLKDRQLPCNGALTPVDLTNLILLLENAPALRRELVPSPKRDISQTLAIIARMVHDGTCPIECACYCGMAQFNQTGDPEVAMQVFNLFPRPEVQVAIVSHFLLSAQLLRQWLECNWLAIGTADYSAIRRQDTKHLSERLFGWYDAVHQTGAASERRGQVQVDQAVGDTINLIEMRLVPAISKRIMNMTQQSLPDHEISRVKFVEAFHFGFRERGIAAASTPWLAAVVDHVNGLFGGLTGACAKSSCPDQSFLALAKVWHLAVILGGRSAISALNISLITAVTAVLHARNQFDSVENDLISLVIAVAQDERKSSKWWISPEVSALLEIAEHRGLIT